VLSLFASRFDVAIATAAEMIESPRFLVLRAGRVQQQHQQHQSTRKGRIKLDSSQTT